MKNADFRRFTGVYARIEIVDVFSSVEIYPQNETKIKNLAHNSCQVRSGMGTYASPRPPCDGTPSPSVWPSPRQTPGPPCAYPSDRPASGHHPDRRQARHAHILQIGLRLVITRAMTWRLPGPPGNVWGRKESSSYTKIQLSQCSHNRVRLWTGNAFSQTTFEVSDSLRYTEQSSPKFSLFPKGSRGYSTKRADGSHGSEPFRVLRRVRSPIIVRIHIISLG